MKTITNAAAGVSYILFALMWLSLIVNAQLKPDRSCTVVSVSGSEPCPDLDTRVCADRV